MINPHSLRRVGLFFMPPRRETLEKIAEVLGVKAGWLMFGA